MVVAMKIFFLGLEVTIPLMGRATGRSTRVNQR
jgi:hypothetical protein